MAALQRLTLLLCFLIPVEAAGMPENGNYMILGAGTFSCGGWTKVRRGNRNQDYANAQWLLGYLTAVNLYAPGPHNISGDTDVEGLRAWMDKFCAENPLEDISRGAQLLVYELRNRAQ